MGEVSFFFVMTDTHACASVSALASSGKFEQKLNGSCLKLDVNIPDNRFILKWNTPPKTVLILGKYFDPECRDLMLEIANWLDSEKNLCVILPDEISSETKYPGHSEVENFQDKVDFIVGIGGDGTLLYVNSLFPTRVPPVIPFKVGSLAFVSFFLYRSE